MSNTKKDQNYLQCFKVEEYKYMLMFHKDIFSTYGWIGFPVVNSNRINEVSEMVEGYMEVYLQINFILCITISRFALNQYWLDWWIAGAPFINMDLSLFSNVIDFDLFIQHGLAITTPVKCGMQLLINSKTSMVAPLKFENG